MAVRLARLFLVVALLAGWQSALVHAVKHVDDAGRLVHLGGDSRDASCAGLDALTACAPQATAVPQIFPQSDSSPALLARAPRVAQAPPFLAQGPPAAV